MEEKKLRQLFKNRADAYLNTIDESVEQGMSEDCFIKAVNEVFSLHVVSNQRELLNDFVRKYNASTEKFDGISEDSVDCYFRGIL